ncbi:MAG: type II toxin-antitoxin system VapB family antitoxin [Pseudomonadota bacterium]
MGKLRLDIDERLLEEATQAAGVKTGKQAIEAGLGELIRKKQRKELIKELGTYDLDLALGKLMRQRNER